MAHVAETPTPPTQQVKDLADWLELGKMRSSLAGNMLGGMNQPSALGAVLARAPLHAQTPAASCLARVGPYTAAGLLHAWLRLPLPPCHRGRHSCGRDQVHGPGCRGAGGGRGEGRRARQVQPNSFLGSVFCVLGSRFWILWEGSPFLDSVLWVLYFGGFGFWGFCGFWGCWSLPLT